MKKIILFLIFVYGCSFAQVSSRTAIFKLPQWASGNKLNSGTESDSSQSNNGLNNGFYRLETIISRSIDTSGYLKQLYGIGSGDLLINSNTHHTAYVQVDDSLYVAYNLNVEKSASFGSNVNVSGYITLDSIKSRQNLWINNAVGIGESLTVYSAANFVSGITLGANGGVDGVAKFFAGIGSNIIYLEPPTSVPSDITVKLPNASGNIGLRDGNQDFTSVASETFTERSGTPSNPTSGTEARIYMKGDKLIIQFNDGGTVRYKYLDLTGTGVTWTHTTSAP